MSHLYQELTHAQLEPIIAAHLPGTFTAEKLTGGLFNTTSLITMESGDRYVLRLGPVNRHLLLPFEQTLMQGEMLYNQLAQEAGIPGSDVVVCDASRSLIDRDYMLVRYIDSLPMTSKDIPREARPGLHTQVGRVTAKLHSITGSQFGRLSQIAVGQGCSSWGEWVLRAAGHWRDCSAASGILPPEECGAIFALYARYLPLFNEITVPHLVHADLWDGNILVQNRDDGWHIAAVIDGDRSVFGDIDFEFASGWMINDAFLSGYGVSMAEGAASVLRRMLYKLLYELNDFYICTMEYDVLKDAAQHLNAARTLIGRINCKSQLSKGVCAP